MGIKSYSQKYRESLNRNPEFVRYMRDWFDLEGIHQAKVKFANNPTQGDAFVRHLMKAILKYEAYEPDNLLKTANL